MKKIYILTTLFLSFCFIGSSQLLMNEDFDYGSSAGDLVALSGGNWTNHSGTTTIQYQTSSLSMASYPSSGVGGSVIVDGTRSEDANRAFAVQTSGTIYASALMNITSASTTENYFMHFMSGTTIFYSRLYAKDDGSGNLNLGIRETNTGTINYSTTNYSYNTTYLVVIKYDFTAGEASLFVLTAVTGTEPAANAVSNDGTNGTTLDKIGLRQSADIPLTTVDGIRVANTWADLMTMPASPSIQFASSTASYGEAAGTVSVTLNISPATAGAETATIGITNNTTTYAVDYTTTPNGATSSFTINVGAGVTSVTFDISINDDGVIEGDETVTFNITGTSAGLAIGGINSITVTIVDNDLPITPIRDIQATTSGDASDMVGNSVTTGGIVSAVKSGNGFYIQDNPGAWNGIYVYDAGANTVARGDSVVVTGTVAEFAPGGSTEKSTQIASLTSFLNVGVFTPHASTNLTTNDMNDEMYEGVLITVTSSTVVVELNGFGEYEVNDGSGNAMVDDFLYLTTPAPVNGEVYYITGVVNHNFSRYKMLPRDAADVTKVLSIEEKLNRMVTIYPNPSKGRVTINYDGSANVEVYNNLGQVVLTTTAKSFELPQGVYSVNILTDKGSVNRTVIVE